MCRFPASRLPCGVLNHQIQLADLQMASRTGLGLVLKRYRAAAGLSQEGLAARAGLSTRAISDLERGLHRAPHGDTLDRLAAALALSAQQRAVLLAAARPELDGALALPVPMSTAPTAGHGAMLARSLPLPPTALIGRVVDQANAMSILRDGGTRLLTVTGPSGVGKTRLALAVARELSADFADGVAFVELAAIRDAALVPAAIAQALGVRERSDILSDAALAERVSAHVGDQRLLLVLDNAEHVLDAAPFIADLLARCPGLVVLATSRAPLRLRAERALPLEPLPLGDAVALFRERARAARPDGTYDADEVATICEWVDRLPLAIELAAAQVRALALPQLRDHLAAHRLALLRGGARDLPARQRVMEDAIGWSYELLAEPERRCFRALGVFVGGWTLDAARAVCWGGDGEGGADVAASHVALPALAALVDASLIQTDMTPMDGSPRFALLELMREYALERLRDAGEEVDCRRRHAAYYTRLAEAAMRLAPGPGEGTSAARLALDLPNARAALEWAERHADAEQGLRLLGFARLWHVRGQIGEAVHWQERMLALDAQARERGEPAGPLALRATMLYGFARTLLGAGELARAAAAATEAVRLAEIAGDERALSDAHATIGLVAQADGRLDEAAEAFTASYAHAQLTGERGLGVPALFHMAELARLRAEFERAGTLLEQALALARASGDAWDVAIITTMLGHHDRQRGRYPQARARYHESLPLFRAFGSPTYLAWCLEGLAATLGAQGWHGRAARLCAAAAALREHAHTPLPPAERATFADTIAAARATLGEPAFSAEWAAGSVLTLDAAVDTALAADEAHTANGA
jgi:predicted ATPase/transcriptional regulator with XRE-family HTH domain